MLDIHCHILPGVDDGSPDLATSLEMARILVEAGFEGVAPSPHLGEGPGGNVGIQKAVEKRQFLQSQLIQNDIPLRLYANAEHHITPTLFSRIDTGDVVPLGEGGRWLLVELPWKSVPRVEDIFFRLALKGYFLILAHPERYSYLDVDTVGRLVDRGIKMQLELGSFVNLYGRRAKQNAEKILSKHWGHVLATDMHHAKDTRAWLAKSLKLLRKRYGQKLLDEGVRDNPMALLKCAQPHTVEPCTLSL
jgi:protein-tyrosine phosphatase